MRISSSLVFQTGLNTINSQQSDLLHVFQQIGSGQRMVTPADDPLAAAQAINIAQSQSLNQRYAANRATANQNLATEEDALNSLTLLMQDVRTRVVEAANGTLSDADRQTLADVLSKARDAALGIANTTDGNGQYLFSGSLGDVKAYGDDGVYQGDGLQRLIQADQTRQISGGDVGRDVFERAQPGTRAYSSEQMAQGAGSTAVIGEPVIADNTAGNGDAKLQFSVHFFDGPGGALQYSVSSTDVSVDGGLTTLGVPTDWVPGTTTLDLGSGTQVAISGDPAAGDEFQVAPLQYSSTNLFASLDKLIGALQAPSQADAQAGASLRNVLNTSLQTFASSYDNILTVRSSIGARMNELSSLDQSGTQRDLGYQQALSDLEDLDYYEATTRLSLRRMALEGAGLAFQTIQNLSLFNMGGK